jgi:membrane protease YdiL (CAAX protease family)
MASVVALPPPLAQAAARERRAIGAARRAARDSRYKDGLRESAIESSKQRDGPPGPLPPDSPDADRASARPSPWPAIATYAVTFVLALVSSTLLVFAVAYVRTGGERSRLQAVAYEFALSAQGLMAGALVNALVLGAAAFGAARLLGRSAGDGLRLGPSRASPLGWVAVTAGLVGLNFAGGTTGELLRLRGSGVMDTLALSLRGPSIGLFAGAVLAIGVAPGFAEETFFRGFLQTRLAASWGRWPAIIATAAAFGLIHLDPVQGTLAFLAGLFLGWVADRLEGVRPSILAHVTNNAIFVGLSAVGSASPGSRGAQIALVAVGTCLWGAAVLLLRSPRALAN